MPGAMVSTLLVVAAWAYFIWTGSISTHLADVRDCQPAARVRRAGGRDDRHHQRRQGALRVGHLRPLAFVSITTLTAGALSVRDNF